ncbi:hypothetical protein ABIA39_003573 [Nocardia sp. GAS34]
MAERRSTLLPSELWRAPLRTVRPQDLAGIYAQPGPEVPALSDVPDTGAAILRSVSGASVKIQLLSARGRTVWPTELRW